MIIAQPVRKPEPPSRALLGHTEALAGLDLYRRVPIRREWPPLPGPRYPGGTGIPHPETFANECNDVSVAGVRRWIAVGSLAVLCTACSTGSRSSIAPGSPTDTGAAGLRAAAVAWSDAFLTGSVADIRGMQSPSCLSGGTTANPTLAKDYLRGIRAAIERHLGAPLSSIRITGVQVRNVTATTEDGEVQYDLPASVVGNDNWVSYGYQDGEWKVTNCHAPIGGESSSASPSTSSATSTTL